MPSTALTQPILRRGNAAVLTGKCFLTASSSNSGGMLVLCGRVGCGFGSERRGAPAARRPAGGDRGFTRLLDGAALHRLRAARVKGAAPRQRRQIGWLAGDREQLFLAAELWHRADQRLGVGVLRRVE